MNTPKRFLNIGFILLVATLLLFSAASAKKPGDFAGAWYSLDQDGSHQWLWINEYYGVYDLLWFDDMCSACTAPGLRPSCLIVGSGHLSSSDTIDIYGAELYCYWEEGAELWDQTLDPDSHIYMLPSDLIEVTIGEYSMDWERTNQKKPEKIIQPITVPKPPACEPEICDGIDNDCDGDIDEDLVQNCYTGPPGTQNVGSCVSGTQTCSLGEWGPCQDEVIPAPDYCDGLDNDCDGVADEGCYCDLLTNTCPGGEACYWVDVNTTMCLMEGPAQNGDICSYDLDCAANLTCVKLYPDQDNSFCLPTCLLSAPACPGGTTCIGSNPPRIYSGEEYGICY